MQRNVRANRERRNEMDPITLKALELAKESSDRARAVLLIMQVTCIVVFMAAWREARFGWTSTRLRTAQAAVWYLNCKEQFRVPPLRRRGPWLKVGHMRYSRKRSAVQRNRDRYGKDIPP